MIFAVGDLHLDSLGTKPMDVFGDNWINHDFTIFNNWREIVTDDDLVLIPGDVSWALKLSDAGEDLERIDNLPGKKIITKGNHDYWWSSIKKLTDLNLKSITFLNNSSYLYDDVAIFGTRGWTSKDVSGFDESDEVIFKREILRMENSIKSFKGECNYRIFMLHYPPFNQDKSPNEFAKVLEENNIDMCIYGHLHAEGHKFAVNEKINNVEYRCVASDYIDFKPVLIYK